MVPTNQLAEDAVSLTIDADGAVVTAKRGAAGKVWLSCTCAEAAAEGWCQHEVALLCGRTDGVAAADHAGLKVFEQIVGGTRVQEAGQALDTATVAFDEGLRAFDAKRPQMVSGRNLGNFADLITDLAACAGELEDASGSLRRLLARS
jgi:uncharacterized Zn finger protein